MQPTDRLLDALNEVKWHQDGSLGFRRSCAHGICGSDAMMINGKNALACKLLVKDVAPRVVIEPIRGLPVLRDLIVDMEPFFEGYRSVLPYLVNDEGEPVTERLQSPEERARFDETTKCILCAACTTSPRRSCTGRRSSAGPPRSARRALTRSRPCGTSSASLRSLTQVASHLILCARP